MPRRDFLKLGGGLFLSGSLATALSACESNRIEPLVSGGRVPFLTPNSEFYVQNGAQASMPDWQMPNLDPASHLLSVDGLVGTPGTFRLDDLKSLAAGREVTYLKTMQCVFDAPLVSGPTGLTGNASWTGVPLAAVLEASGGPSPGAVRLRFHGVDGFGNNIRLSRLTDPAFSDLPPPAIIYAMNGLPLPRAHGAPFRLLLPETFGYKNVKWLARMEATADDTAFGTYQANGFFDEGTLAVSSRVTGPLNGARLPAGLIEVTGVALAGAGSVAAVELSIDAGPWLAADILSPDTLAAEELLSWPGLDTTRQTTTYPWRGVWVIWRYSWPAAPGSHRLAFRARDTTGAVQPDADSNLFDGTNGVSRMTVTVS